MAFQYNSAFSVGPDNKPIVFTFIAPTTIVVRIYERTGSYNTFIYMGGYRDVRVGSR